MVADTETLMNATFFRCWITVKQMKDFIAELEDEDIISPNYVGGLSVFRDKNQKMIGYIDFVEEKFYTE